jgi:hypothetical protein
LDKKTPLQQPTRGKSRAKIIANTGSRKHAVFFGPLLFRLPVAAEGRFERLLRQFTSIDSNRTPMCQSFQLIKIEGFVRNYAERIVAGWGNPVSG